MLVFGERHQVHVVVAPDNEDALAGVTVRVRMLQEVEQTLASRAVCPRSVPTRGPETIIQGANANQQGE